MPTLVTVEELLAGHSAGVRTTVERLREVVRGVMPEADERVYPGWHGIGYRHPKAGYVCGIFPLEHGVKLGFEWGALLRDEFGVLLPGPTGKKQVRYVKCADAKTVPAEAIVSLLLEAVDLRAGGG